VTSLERAAAGSAVLAAVVFFPSLFHGFAYDDLSVIVQHEALHDLANLPRLLVQPFWPGTRGVELGLWRPASTGALAALWSVGGGAAWPFHLANIVLHAGAAALVAALVGSLFGVTGAWVAGLLFAVHPVHVEAVANAVGLAEMLSAVPVLLACLIVARSRGDTPLGAGRTWSLIGLYAFALLAKEVAAVLPALLVLVEWWRDRTPVRGLGAYLRRRWALYGAMLAVLTVVLVARGALLASPVGGAAPLGAEWLEEAPRIWTMAAVWLEYARLMVWPVRLLPDYSPDIVSIRPGWDVVNVAGVVFGLGLLLMAWAAERQRPKFGAGIPLATLFFIVAVLPVANLVFLSGVLLAERSLYLPSVGLSIAVAGMAAAVPPARRRWALAAAALPLALLALRAVTYTPVWNSQASVFDHMLSETPESARAHWVRADILLGEGRHDEALVAYRAAISPLGEAYMFLTLSANRLQRAGFPDQARALYRRAWWVDSTHVAAPRGLAMLATARADWPAARAWSGAALDLDHGRVEVWHLYAGALAELGLWAEAASARDSLLAHGERHAWQQWSLLAQARARSGDLVGARAALDSALARAGDPVQLARTRAVLDSLGAF
jgi:tetratricopeptide (TPR) repeat protein